MKFIILHGWGGTPQINWFPWLKSEVEKLGYRVEVPDLPNTNTPKLDEWLSTINKLLAEEKDSVVLIGHSLGGVLMLHYLEQQRKTPPIKLAVFVASWGEDDGVLEPELANFFPKPFDFSKIKSSAEEFVSISGTNDPYIGKKFSENLVNDLGIKPIWVENGGHLNEEFGFKEFPLLLEVIKKELFL